ncbi:hypothetical protein pb186bvf_002355 [Paramecium bursaria]
MNFDQKLKQLEKYLIVHKVNNNNKYIKPINTKKPLHITKQILETRQKELQNIVNRNYKLLYNGYQLQPKIEQSSEFLKQFIEEKVERDRGRNNTIRLSQKAKTFGSENTQPSKSTPYLPYVINQLSSDQGCELIMNSCDQVKQGLRKIQRQQKRGLQKCDSTHKKMYNTLQIVQTSNFLNNDLILF